MAENKGYRRVGFFDADKTIWRVVTKDGADDWASKVPNATFSSPKPGTVLRMETDTRFELKDEVEDCLTQLSKEGIVLGMVSDNVLEDVARVATLLGIWSFFDNQFVNIRLWKGPCPKQDMVDEVLTAQGKKDFSRVVLVDDKDYGDAMKGRGYSFILSPKETFPKQEVLDFFGLK